MKGLLQSVLAFGASWFGAVWYWRSTNRMPATGELATYLIALPVALLLAFWVLAKGAALWQARSAAAPAGPVQDNPTPADTTAVAAPIATTAALHIAAAALCVPHGESAAELERALAANTARAELDPALEDDDGFPVMCARAAYIDEAAMEESIRQWREDESLPPMAARPEYWRALALATPVMRDLAVTAASHEALANKGSAAQTVPMLQLALLLPADWPTPWREAAGQWLQQQLAGIGWPRQRSAVTIYPESTPATLLAMLHGSGLPCFTLLLACASNVGSHTVNRWSERNVLFTAKQPQGLMPGEGAAGLLLASSEHAARMDALSAPAPQLAAIHAGSAGRNILTQLAQSSCQTAPARIVADTGHSSERVMEVMGAAHALLPELDPTQDIATLGTATGHAGHAGAMAALAYAVHETQARNQPVLCLTNEDPQQRCAVLIAPAASATPGS
ncbi:hypothetical protein GCM10027277_10850 [Pseudoduganella ginsengisoli]